MGSGQFEHFSGTKTTWPRCKEKRLTRTSRGTDCRFSCAAGSDPARCRSQCSRRRLESPENALFEKQVTYDTSVTHSLATDSRAVRHIDQLIHLPIQAMSPHGTSSSRTLSTPSVLFTWLITTCKVALNSCVHDNVAPARKTKERRQRSKKSKFRNTFGTSNHQSSFSFPNRFRPLPRQQMKRTGNEQGGDA